MEIITKTFDNAQLEKMITEVVAFLGQNKIEQAIVFYGWDCETDNQYADIKVPVRDLEDFISKSQKDGIFKLGTADLYISDVQKTLEFLLCHESDVHFKSDNEDLIEGMRQTWIKKGYAPYDAKNTKKSIKADYEE